MVKEFNIDCYGKHFPNEQVRTFSFGDVKLNFIFDLEEKKGNNFVLGLYINRAVTESDTTGTQPFTIASPIDNGQPSDSEK